MNIEKLLHLSLSTRGKVRERRRRREYFDSNTKNTLIAMYTDGESCDAPVVVASAYTGVCEEMTAASQLAPHECIELLQCV